MNYAVASQDPSGVVIGKLAIEHPPYPHRDLLTMKGAGISCVPPVPPRDRSAQGVEDVNGTDCGACATIEHIRAAGDEVRETAGTCGAR